MILLGYTLNSKMFGNLDSFFFFLSKAIIQGKKVDARGGAMSRPAFFVFAWRQGLKAKRVLRSSATLPAFCYCKRFEDCVHRLKAGLL